MTSYLPQNWYWIVGGDATQVWSTEKKVYVPIVDTTYIAWLAAGNKPYATGSIGGVWRAIFAVDPDYAMTITPLGTASQQLADAYPSQKLAAYRFTKETMGVMFQASGVGTANLFATDPGSQSKMTSAFLIASAGKWIDGAVWKTSDGHFVPLTTADIGALAAKIATYVQACFTRESELKLALETNPAIDITTGWPSNT